MQRPNILFLSLAIFTVGILNLSGCGNSDNSDKSGGDKTPSAGANQDSEVQKDAGNLTGPAAATHAFLDATRRGDDDKLMALLTSTAQREITDRQLKVGISSSDTAKFVIGEVRKVSPAIAHVASRWTDVDINGESISHEMIWTLRNEGGDWRIGGVAIVIFKDSPPLLLNFEKPDEMNRQKQLLHEEVTRRMQQAAQKNSQPTDPIRR